MAGMGGNSRYQAVMGGSDVGLLSVIRGFLPAYYRFWVSVSASRGAVATLSSAASTCFAKNFDVQITPLSCNLQLGIRGFLNLAQINADLRRLAQMRRRLSGLRPVPLLVDGES